MKMKKIIALFLCTVLLLSLGACKRTKEVEVTTPSFKPIETAPQKEYTDQDIKDIYNTAVQKIIDSKSYHMNGSYSSTSVYGEMMATVVSTVDLTYEVRETGPVGYFDVMLNREGNEMPHTTYHDHEHYYFYAYDWKYYTNTNDYTDYYAQDFLKLLGDVEIKNADTMDQMDGSLELTFDVRMGDYDSTGILGIIGDFTSETVADDILSISVTIDENGVLTYFYMSFNSQVMVLDESAEQTIVLSMSMDGYDTVTVTTPNLEEYENNVVEQEEHEHDQVGILSPEDVD